jgi:hypothetical protein
MLIEQLSSIGITEHRLYYLTEYPVHRANYRRPIKNCGSSLLQYLFHPIRLDCESADSLIDPSLTNTYSLLGIPELCSS